MRIGILELLADSIVQTPVERLVNTRFRKQFASIMPQAISVWCRRLGHRTFYATYYGQCDPRKLLPGDLDIVFISTYTPASALAYALAKVFRSEGSTLVMGGPHATAFPQDCLRFFDLVVHRCDKELLERILKGDVTWKTVVSSPKPLSDLPSVEERMPEISRANFKSGRPSRFTNVALLNSIGCPYACDFCVDWNNPYSMLSADRLAEDLRYISKHLPGVLISYHDPNFGVKFDQALEVIESLPGDKRNPYIMESSLSILREDRIERLKQTNCVFIAPGIESWGGYSNKAGVGGATGRDKMERVVRHFEQLHAVVPGLQANFIVQPDVEDPAADFELTREFLERTPYVYPALNIPIPFGGTPLYDRLLEQDRILRAMPFAFYYMPHLVTLLEEDPYDYYARVIALNEIAGSNKMMLRRMKAVRGLPLKALVTLRMLTMRENTHRLKRIQSRLRTNVEFNRFHVGKRKELPAFYREQLTRRLGRYSKILTVGEITPVFQMAEIKTITRRPRLAVAS